MFIFEISVRSRHKAGTDRNNRSEVPCMNGRNAPAGSCCGRVIIRGSVMGIVESSAIRMTAH